MAPNPDHPNPIDFQNLRNSEFHYRYVIPSRHLYILAGPEMSRVAREAAQAFGKKLVELREIGELREVRLCPFDIVLVDAAKLPDTLPDWIDDRQWHEQRINANFFIHSGKPAAGLELHCIEVHPHADVCRRFLKDVFEHNEFLRRSMYYKDLQGLSFYGLIVPYYSGVAVGSLLTLSMAVFWSSWLCGPVFGAVAAFLNIVATPYLLHAIVSPLPNEKTPSTTTTNSKLWIFSTGVLTLVAATWQLGLLFVVVILFLSFVLYIRIMHETIDQEERQFARFVFEGDWDGYIDGSSDARKSGYAGTLFRNVIAGEFRNLTRPSAACLKRIFISHRNDTAGRQLSRDLYRQMEALELSPYIDFLHLRGGSLFRAQLAEAFNACGVFVSVLTQTEKVDWMRRELEFAYLKTKGFGYPLVIAIEAGLTLEQLGELTQSTLIPEMSESPRVIRRNLSSSDPHSTKGLAVEILSDMTRWIRSMSEEKNNERT